MWHILACGRFGWRVKLRGKGVGIFCLKRLCDLIKLFDNDVVDAVID